MKYALVTGGSRGIGRAVSCKLAEMGYFILINYQNNDAEAEKTLQLVQEKGSNGELMKFDVTDPAAITLALGNWASQHPDEYIEVLINNAGIRKDNLMLWMTGEEWKKIFALNSTNFYLENYNGKLRMVTVGKGHDMGMSLYGANALAEKQITAATILSYYYPGTKVVTPDLPQAK